MPASSSLLRLGALAALLATPTACQGTSLAAPPLWTEERLPATGGTCAAPGTAVQVYASEDAGGRWRVEVHQREDGTPLRLAANRQHPSGAWVTLTYLPTEDALLVLEKPAGGALRRLELARDDAHTSPWAAWVQALARNVESRCGASAPRPVP